MSGCADSSWGTDDYPGEAFLRFPNSWPGVLLAAPFNASSAGDGSHGRSEIDLLRQRATRAGQKLELTSKEFLLLTLLARRPGEVLSRTLIAESVGI